MKIAVIAANGKAGQKIVAEAVRRNVDVTAWARGNNKTEATHFTQKDIFDITKEDMAEYDVVIDAFGTWSPDTMHLYSDVVVHLADVLSETATRLLVVGGAGSLYTNKEHTLTVADAPDFPDEYKPVATAHAASLAVLRTRSDVCWTYISPACDFVADGERTGEYLLAGEELRLNDRGESRISYADYAIAVIDEALNGNHVQQRISVLGK